MRTFRRLNGGESGCVLRRAVCALSVAAMMWLAPPGRTETAGAEVHGAPLDESVNFYQYTDKDDVIHFVDSREKIPRRYQDRVIVRKDTPAALQTTSVVIIDNQIHMPVSFRNGDKTVQAILVLDTGASITSITETLAARLGIDPKNTRAVSMGLADGRMIDIQVTRVDAVGVGARMKFAFEIGILPDSDNRKELDGYLGVDFLRSFPYLVDFQSNLIRWQ